MPSLCDRNTRQTHNPLRHEYCQLTGEPAKGSASGVPLIRETFVAGPLAGSQYCFGARRALPI